MNYLLNNGLYCTKRVHSHLPFGQLLHGLKSLTMGCVPIFVIAWTEMFLKQSTPSLSQLNPLSPKVNWFTNKSGVKDSSVNTCQDIQDHIEPKKLLPSHSEVSAVPTGCVRDPNLHGTLGCLSVLPSCFLCPSSLCQKCVSKKWKTLTTKLCQTSTGIDTPGVFLSLQTPE